MWNPIFAISLGAALGSLAMTLAGLASWQLFNFF